MSGLKFSSLVAIGMVLAAAAHAEEYRTTPAVNTPATLPDTQNSVRFDTYIDNSQQRFHDRAQESQQRLTDRIDSRVGGRVGSEDGQVDGLVGKPESNPEAHR